MSDEKLKAVYDAIPHRPPFLFVDEIVESAENKIVTRTKMDGGRDFFRGHYPGRPIVPGVILCEAAFQSGAILISSLLKGKIDLSQSVPVVTRVSEVKFRKMVSPDEVIETTVEIVEKVGPAYFMKAQISSGGKNAVRCEFAVSLVESEGGKGQ
ncbi:MAG TPA: 3-hydroxyacyl-ACP dehydratase FabZ family protein [Candidatus Wallbacteria bacterium]|nr:MAG: 3-hydroxyacyl-(acyl-carrier-protein) dehydratase FabZ [bacterium ADurb.Bin243]HOD39089.1 3-hydroxyacyl-ACP dehydratase FabZ family protein [Candidatus Wallbacteria bacterium]HPG56311.1 3-hydroxyacyl-ACP dehydratase FabZ family protein [Candidatus Wallbacteria bacterium]